MEEKKLSNSNIFLGKKLESSEKCKLCHKKENLIKCIKCLNYYCYDCLSNVYKISLVEIKKEKYLCNNCAKKNEESKKANECFICKRSLNGINFTCFNITKEQQIKLKEEIKEIVNKKEMSLSEEESIKNEEKNLNQKILIKICKECNLIYEQILVKCLLIKKEKEGINQKNIIGELTNIIKKENGVMDVNIFDILENKPEIIDDYSKDNIKKKPKDLFESVVVNKTEKEKEIKNNIKRDESKNCLKIGEKNIINNNNYDKNIEAININANNQTPNIFLPNMFNISQLQNNQKLNNNIFNQRFSRNLLQFPNFLNNIHSQNNINTKINIIQNIKETQNNNNIQNHLPKILNNNNNILNNDIGIDNKLNNTSKNIKEIKAEINNLININNANNKDNTDINNINPSITNTMSKISKCLYDFDNNNIENCLSIINKLEILVNFFLSTIQEHNTEQKKEIVKEETNKESQKEPEEELKNDKNNKEIINGIYTTTESLKSQLKTLKENIDMKKLFLHIIYQNIDLYLKEKEKNKDKSKDVNQIPQSNINNIIPQFNPINTLNNFQGINLLNNLDINTLSNNLIFPISPILTNNNNITANHLPFFTSPINIPNILSQTRINSLGNSIFQ